MAEITKETVYIKMSDACKRYGISRPTIRKVAAKCGALVTKCEGVSLIDYKKMDEYMKD